jgi:hypothetical protein
MALKKRSSGECHAFTWSVQRMCTPTVNGCNPLPHPVSWAPWSHAELEGCQEQVWS